MASSHCFGQALRDASHFGHDHEVKRGISESSPYVQCVFLASDWAIAAYVQSVRFRLLQLNVIHNQHPV